MDTIFYCKSLNRYDNAREKNMDIVRRVATGLSGGMVIDYLDDATIVRLLRQYTGWKHGVSFADMRKKIRIVERIENVDLDTLVSAEEMRTVFNEVGNTLKYPLV